MKDCIFHVLNVLFLFLTNTLPNQIPDIFRGSSRTHVNTVHAMTCIAATCINHDLSVFCFTRTVSELSLYDKKYFELTSHVL